MKILLDICVSFAMNVHTKVDVVMESRSNDNVYVIHVIFEAT